MTATRVGPPPLPVLPAPWRIRVTQPHGTDLDTVHRWMLAPHVARFWHQAWSRDRWAEEIASQLEGNHSRSCLVHQDADEPMAYVEIYRVERDLLASCYPTRSHDLGMHIAIGEAGHTNRGLGTALIREIANGLLAADEACTRVVAEPDVTNAPSVKAFGRAGFRQVGEIVLPYKTAALMVRARTEADLPTVE